MDFKYRMTVLDAADMDVEATFWAGLLKGRIEGNDRWRNIWIDSNWQLGVQLAEDHVRPTWPDNSIPQQMHFDLYVVGIEALDAASDQVIKLGGQILRPAVDRSTASGCEVHASPAGHPFCLCWLPY